MGDAKTANKITVGKHIVKHPLGRPRSISDRK
jgi:hypothetical protein